MRVKRYLSIDDAERFERKIDFNYSLNRGIYSYELIY